VRLSPLGTSATIWPIVPAPDDDECGAVGGMRIGRGSRRTRRKPAPASLCPSQIPHDLTWDRTRWEARDEPHALWRGLRKSRFGFTVVGQRGNKTMEVSAISELIF
jgi:hypothetical protein